MIDMSFIQALYNKIIILKIYARNISNLNYKIVLKGSLNN